LTSRTELEAIIEPVVEGLGYELVGVEYIPQGRHSILRVYIDKPDGINIDDCSAVSRQISGVMDVEDPIHGEYNLEVSSPGLDRPLFKLSHYEQFIGERCSVRLKRLYQERRKFKGVIAAVGGEAVTFKLEHEVEFEVPFDEIDKANLEPEF
jgi:ribosome maturation factor RimP